MRKIVFLLLLTAANLGAEQVAEVLQAPAIDSFWFPSGEPTEAGYTWSFLDQLSDKTCHCVTLPAALYTTNSAPVFNQVQASATFGISIWTSSPLETGRVPIYSPSEVTDVSVAVNLTYSDDGHRFSNLDPEWRNLWRDDYFGFEVSAFLLRVADTSPCPLKGMAGLWAYSNDVQGPFTDAEVLAARPNAFPLPSGGNSSPIRLTNNWICRFTDVPVGKYIFYVASEPWGELVDGPRPYGTNGAAATIEVSYVGGRTSPYSTLLSPTNNLTVNVGDTVPIHYRLVTSKGSVLSWNFFSVLVDGQILTNHFFGWADRATTIDKTVFWRVTTPGSHVIKLYANDTACDNQDTATGIHSITVNALPNASNTQYLRMTSKLAGDRTISLSMGAAAGETYQLQLSSNLARDSWVNVGSAVTASSSVVELPQISATNLTGFYRVTLSTPGTPSDWRNADLVFPAGTQVIKIHFDDAYTLNTNRNVKLGVRGADTGWGWQTSVYPDSFAAETGLKNPTFYLSGGSGIGVLPFTGLDVLRPGEVYSAIVECQQIGDPNFFNFNGWEGLMHIDAPEALLRGSRRFYMKIPLHGAQTFTFAVAPAGS